MGRLRGTKSVSPTVANRVRLNKQLFLSAMIDPSVFTIKKACEIANVAYTTVYAWSKEDLAFASAIANAKEIQTQNMEQVAGERAMGIRAKPSDMLMMFLLNGRRPEVYRQNSKITHEGAVTLHQLVLEE